MDGLAEGKVGKNLIVKTIAKNCVLHDVSKFNYTDFRLNTTSIRKKEFCFENKIMKWPNKLSSTSRWHRLASFKRKRI